MRRRGSIGGSERGRVAVVSAAVVSVAAALAAVALVLGVGAGPAGAQAVGPVPEMAPDEIVAFLDRVALPGTTPSPGVPGITGDGAADARIVARARATDYRQRPLAAVGLTGTAGVPLNPEAADALHRMRGAAGAAGAPFGPTSGFRSVDDQRGIFLRQLAARGAQRIGRAYTNAEIAAGVADAAIDDVLRLNSIPGFSFHHSGDTVDLVAPGGSLGSFGQSAAYRWLSANNYANAKAHGFLPSYPVGASAIGPEPEPWEFTYVGVHAIQCAGNVVTLADRVPGRCPVGSLDSVEVRGTIVSATGWAADPDAPTRASEVHLYADGVGVAVLRADAWRPDVDAVTGLGPSHGFRGTVALAPGGHILCAYALNDVGGEANTLLGCRYAVVTTTPPVGAVDRVTAEGDGVRLVGWTADPDQPASTLDVHVYVDGRGAAVLRAGRQRPDVAAATGLGSAHGFSARVAVPTGWHEVCLYAISPQRGEANRRLGCRTVWSLGSTPTGVVDRVAADGRAIVVEGWAADGHAPTQALPVHVYVDGRGAAVLTADRARGDVGRAYGIGAEHGFRARIPSAVGRHQVCAYAIAVEAGDPNALLGCRSVVVEGRSPVGALDVAGGTPGGIRVAGWTADPDRPAAALDVHVYVDGVGAAVLRADRGRPDVAATTPFGARHGFSAGLPTSPGVRTVCVWAITPEPDEPSTLLGCRRVVVPAPSGASSSATTSGPVGSTGPEPAVGSEGAGAGPGGGPPASDGGPDGSGAAVVPPTVAPATTTTVPRGSTTTTTDTSP